MRPVVMLCPLRTLGTPAQGPIAPSRPTRMRPMAMQHPPRNLGKDAGISLTIRTCAGREQAPEGLDKSDKEERIPAPHHSALWPQAGHPSNASHGHAAPAQDFGHRASHVLRQVPEQRPQRYGAWHPQVNPQKKLLSRCIIDFCMASLQAGRLPIQCT